MWKQPLPRNVKEQRRQSKVCELFIWDDDVMRQVLTTRVRAKNSNSSRKLCVNHANKGLVNRTQLTLMFHEINPCVARMVINKNNLILVTTLGSKRWRTPYIWMNKVKWSNRMRPTRRIWKLYMFSKLPLQWKVESTKTYPKHPWWTRVDKRDPHRCPRRWCHLAKDEVGEDTTDDTRPGVAEEGRRKVSKT